MPAVVGANGRVIPTEKVPSPDQLRGHWPVVNRIPGIPIHVVVGGVHLVG
ncbi:hypothetical protein H7H78_04525 [Mycobacterium shinjukuense]|uniref:Uncharacterized protein n=1 Tax=Mycobacterium shinjukuense TaxID=398694 RepID=A0A7I7MNJ2_9MYCO|nr:hypothetical protein [Mycobacterium shinjukuense]MCV6984729.1 hypothetical protein [Mycobacterium shinjukuense]BBX73377.1 hypothetical protein MSHI_12830 [Mycobacterium shinjukuense]